MSAALVAFPGSKGRKPPKGTPAEDPSIVAFRWLLQEKPAGQRILAGIVFDLLERYEPALGSRLRAQYAALHPRPDWDTDDDI